MNGETQELSEAVDPTRKRKAWIKERIKVLLTSGRATNRAHARTIVAAELSLERKDRQLYLDDLTGLYNRRGLFAQGRSLLRVADDAGKKMWVIFADFDSLIDINDTFGHDEGDVALVEVAGVLAGSFRETDVVARRSGDEFVVLAMETDESQTTEKGSMRERARNRLLSQLEKRNDEIGDAKPYKLSLSIGVLERKPEDSRPLDELIHAADKLMYEQK